MSTNRRCNLAKIKKRKKKKKRNKKQWSSILAIRYLLGRSESNLGYNFTPQEKNSCSLQFFQVSSNDPYGLEVVLFSGRFSPRISDGGHRNNPIGQKGYPDIPILSIRKITVDGSDPRQHLPDTIHTIIPYGRWKKTNKKSGKKTVVILCFYYPIIDRIFLHPRWCKIS